MSAHHFPPDRSVEIRRFFLFPEESYSLADLARIWRVALDDVCAMFFEELANAGDAAADPGMFRVSWADAIGAATTFHVFRPFDIELALGDDFERVRGSRWRTIPVVLHLPRCILDALRLIPFVPPSDSLPACAERLLCETVEAELVLQGIRRAPK